jgi:hypothetical protein
MKPQVIASNTDHGAALDALVGASDWAATGSESPQSPPMHHEAARP